MQCKIFDAMSDQTYLLKLTGEVRLTSCAPLEKVVLRKIHDLHDKDMVVDLSEAESIDSTALGLVASMAFNEAGEQHKKPVIICPKDDIYRILVSMQLDKVFDIVKNKSSQLMSMRELPATPESDHVICQRSLDAHRKLIKISTTNQIRFEQVVEQLEKDLHPVLPKSH